MARSPESSIPNNWRNVPDRNFCATKIGHLPNPGDIVWFNGRFWIDEGNHYLRQPSEEERIKIRKILINGEIHIPKRSITKVSK